MKLSPPYTDLKEMKVVLLILALAAIAAFSASVTQGVPAPGLDLDKLTQDSEVIVKGQVISLQEGATVEVTDDGPRFGARKMTAIVKSEQVLKGEIDLSQISIEFLLPEAFRGWKSVGLHEYEVFFLRKGGQHEFEFTSHYYPAVLAIHDIFATGPTAIDRVVAAINGVIGSEDSTAEQKLAAVYLLSRSRSTVSTAALSSSLNSNSLDLRLSAAGALLERNDTRGLPAATEALLDESIRMPDAVKENLLYAISQGLKDPKAIPNLKKLLDSGDSKVRRAAASALMHTRSPDAIAPLMSALSDSDFETQYYGVVGLAEISGQMDWRPTLEDFRSDPQKYLKHWREWAQQPSDPMPR